MNTVYPPVNEMERVCSIDDFFWWCLLRKFQNLNHPTNHKYDGEIKLDLGQLFFWNGLNRRSCGSGRAAGDAVSGLGYSGRVHVEPHFDQQITQLKLIAIVQGCGFIGAEPRTVQQRTIGAS